MLLTTEAIWNQGERIKEHLRLDVRKAASSEEAGQHRGWLCQACGTHSLRAEKD